MSPAIPYLVCLVAAAYSAITIPIEQEIHIYEAQIEIVHGYLDAENCPHPRHTRRAVDSEEGQVIHLNVLKSQYAEYLRLLHDCRNPTTTTTATTTTEPTTVTTTTTIPTTVTTTVPTTTTTPVPTTTTTTVPTTVTTTLPTTTTTPVPTTTTTTVPTTVTTVLPTTVTTVTTTTPSMPNTEEPTSTTTGTANTPTGTTKAPPGSTTTPSAPAINTTTTLPTTVTTALPMTVTTTTPSITTPSIQDTSTASFTPAINTTTTLPTTTVPAGPTTTLTPSEACRLATHLDDPSRLIHDAKQPSADGSYACDRRRSLQWFRFSGAGGDIMLDSCPTKYSCGTMNPLWTDERPPKALQVPGSIITAYVSQSTDGVNNCETEYVDLEVLRCSWDSETDVVYRYIGDYSDDCNSAFCGMIY